jgi:general secretion pathway protein G
MIVSAPRRPAAQRRAAFTLLEVLVVVAILVILAAVAGVYVFGYLEDAKIDTARSQCALFETQCKAYMAKNGGIPPQSLMELVQPSDGRQPLIEGGMAALNDPWQQGGQYQMEIHQDQYGNPDPVVYVISPKTGQPIYSSKRQAMGR